MRDAVEMLVQLRVDERDGCSTKLYQRSPSPSGRGPPSRRGAWPEGRNSLSWRRMVGEGLCRRRFLTRSLRWFRPKRPEEEVFYNRKECEVGGQDLPPTGADAAAVAGRLLEEAGWVPGDEKCSGTTTANRWNSVIIQGQSRLRPDREPLCGESSPRSASDARLERIDNAQYSSGEDPANWDHHHHSPGQGSSSSTGPSSNGSLRDRRGQFTQSHGPARTLPSTG